MLYEVITRQRAVVELPRGVVPRRAVLRGRLRARRAQGQARGAGQARAGRHPRRVHPGRADVRRLRVQHGIRREAHAPLRVPQLRAHPRAERPSYNFV